MGDTTMKQRLFKIKDVSNFCDKAGKKTIFYETEKTAGALWCLKPGQSVFTHAHMTSDDLWIVINGTGTFFPEPGKEVTITQGDMIISYPGEQHGMKNTGDEDFIFVGVAGPIPMDLICYD